MFDHRSQRWQRGLAAGALSLALAGPAALGVSVTAYASPAPAAPAATLLAQAVRPTFQVGETVQITGRLTDPTGQPITGAAVVVTIDHDADAPVVATTDATGAWAVDVSARPGWLPGDIPVEALHLAAPDTPGAEVRTSFTLTVPGAPTTLAVDPVAGPVTQGQDVELSGRLTLPDGRGVGAQSIYLVVDPSGQAAAFASTDEHGTWRARFTVPDRAGTFDDAFPAYAVAVRFDGDPGQAYEASMPLAATSATASLTLSGPPVTRPTPAPTPSAGPVAQVTAPQAAARGVLVEAPRRAVAPMPSVTAPGMLLLGGGMVVLVMGAAMLSHAARLRR